MERARKMVLIPQEELQRMQSHFNDVKSINNNASGPEEPTPLKTTQTPGDNVTRLDDEMRRILDSKNYASENDKFKDFSQLLQRYLFFVDKNRRPVQTLEEEHNYNDKMDDEIIISSLPKVYQKKGRMLINHLKANKNVISWNSAGSVYFHGQKCKDSNIIDLMNYAARQRKNMDIAGKDQFLRVLRETDTPREFVGNNELWKTGVSFSKTNSSKSKYDELEFGNNDDDTDVDEYTKFDDAKSGSQWNESNELSNTLRRHSNRQPQKTSTPSEKKKQKKQSETYWLRMK